MGSLGETGDTVKKSFIPCRSELPSTTPSHRRQDAIGYLPITCLSSSDAETFRHRLIDLGDGRMVALLVPAGRRGQAVRVVAERSAVLRDALLLGAANAVMGSLHVVGDLRADAEGLGGDKVEKLEHGQHC
eukprot:1033999-Rhodomonas_salina.1